MENSGNEELGRIEHDFTLLYHFFDQPVIFERYDGVTIINNHVLHLSEAGEEVPDVLYCLVRL